MKLSFILIDCIIFKLRGSKSTIEKQMMQSDYFFFSPKRKKFEVCGTQKLRGIYWKA